MNNNETAVFEANLGLLARICAAAARLEASSQGFKPPEFVQMTERKAVKVRKMGQLFQIEIVDRETAASSRPFYDGDDYCD